MKHIVPMRLMFILLSAISVAGQAYGQTVAYTQQVVSQLDRARALAQERGFHQTHEYHLDELTTRQTGGIVLELEAGVNYAIVGACDNDCRDLDMILLDENQSIVAEDTRSDDLPILTITPAWTGRFMIGVRVSVCRQSPCVFGLAVFGKDHPRRPASRPQSGQNGIPMGPLG